MTVTWETKLIILHNLYIIMYAVLCTCTLFLQFVGKVGNTKYCVCEKRIALSEIQFSQCDDSIHTS